MGREWHDPDTLWLSCILHSACLWGYFYFYFLFFLWLARRVPLRFAGISGVSFVGLIPLWASLFVFGYHVFVDDFAMN